VVIEVKPTEATSILFGNIKATGLENLTSTRFTTFMDRGPYGDFGVDSYLLSIVGKVQGPNWSVTGAVQGDSINNADINNTSATLTNNQNSNERLGFTGRVHFAPLVTDTDRVHLAVSARYRNHGNEGAFNYQGRTNTNYGTNGLYYKTGAIGDRDTTLAAEGAWIHNSFSVQGEYSNISVERLATTAPGSNPDVKVGYAFVSFWPTGETRNYDPVAGEIKRPKILNPITAGGFGGVELALRYDFADLTEAYDTASTAAVQDPLGRRRQVHRLDPGRELLPDRLCPLPGQLHRRFGRSGRRPARFGHQAIPAARATGLLRPSGPARKGRPGPSFANAPRDSRSPP
jgi:phosphate-selective porin OprO/OprP